MAAYQDSEIPEVYKTQAILFLYYGFPRDVGATAADLAERSGRSRALEETALNAIYLDGMAEITNAGNFRLTDNGIEQGRMHEEVVKKIEPQYDHTQPSGSSMNMN